jgi:hypothetical protein
MNQKIDRNLALISGWIELIRYIKGQVECFGIPLEKILSECDIKQLRAIGYEKEGAPKNFSELLTDGCLPDKETGTLILNFTREFGRYYREEQLNRCNYYITALEEKKRDQTEKLPQRKRMNYTLWLSGCLSVGILLL